MSKVRYFIYFSIGKKNKYQELNEEPERNSNFSGFKSDGANDEFSYNFSIQKHEGNDLSQGQIQPMIKRSKFEGKAGHPKVIKSQNTQQMSEILESVNEAERK